MRHEDDDQRGVLQPAGTSHWVVTAYHAVEEEMCLYCKRFRQDR